LTHSVYAYLLSFPRYNDLLVENLSFSTVLRIPVLFEAITMGSPGTKNVKVGLKKLDSMGY